jgi:hypothetical protein
MPDSAYRIAGRGVERRGKYERVICARYEPNETEDMDIMRVKTSFVIPSMTCDKEGRKSRGVGARLGITSLNQSRFAWVELVQEPNTSYCQLEKVVRDPQKPVTRQWRVIR